MLRDLTTVRDWIDRPDERPILDPKYVRQLMREIKALKQADPEAYRQWTMDLYCILTSTPEG